MKHDIRSFKLNVLDPDAHSFPHAKPLLDTLSTPLQHTPAFYVSVRSRYQARATCQPHRLVLEDTFCASGPGSTHRSYASAFPLLQPTQALSLFLSYLRLRNLRKRTSALPKVLSPPCVTFTRSSVHRPLHEIENGALDLHGPSHSQTCVR
jgi:hypothetical protein